MAEGDRLLSQEEMDAIGEVVASGALDDGYNLGLETTPFELVSNHNRKNIDTEVLEQINERFQRFLRVNLRRELNYSTLIEVGNIEVVEYRQLIDSISKPAGLNVTKISPLKGDCLVFVDPGLIFSCVDVWFGGGEREAKFDVAAREFSATEDLVAKKIRISVYAALIEAWAPSLEVHCEFIRSESDPALIELGGLNDLFVINSFKIGAKGGESGKVDIVYPLESIKLVRGSLLTSQDITTKQNRLEKAWSNRLKHALGEVSFQAVVQAGEIPVSLGELEALQVGDIIPIKDAARSELKVNGLTLHEVEIGMLGGNTAVKILSKEQNENKR